MPQGVKTNARSFIRNRFNGLKLKRTVRDYFFDYKGFNGQNGKDIFVREIELDKGGIQDGKTRAKDFDEKKDRIMNECIDVRLFGGVIPLDKDSIKFTGPVQFKMGRSLHPVELKHIKGTGAFASKPGNLQATFREEYILPYSFICFYGIINENAAVHTRLTEEDVQLLLEGLWNGTKNLISRTKVGQMPRFLLKIDYKDPGFFIGDLDCHLRMDCANLDKMRGIYDFSLNISKLLTALTPAKDKILSISYRQEPSLKITQPIPADWKKLAD